MSTPPMPEGFTDRAAWDAIHWKPSLKGSLIDQAVIGWQRDNQERVAAAANAAARAVKPEGWPEACGRCGAPWTELGFDYGLGFNCRACGGADSDE